MQKTNKNTRDASAAARALAALRATAHAALLAAAAMLCLACQREESEPAAAPDSTAVELHLSFPRGWKDTIDWQPE